MICEKIMSELDLANLLRYYSIFLSELWFIKKMPSYSKFDICSTSHIDVSPGLLSEFVKSSIVFPDLIFNFNWICCKIYNGFISKTERTAFFGLLPHKINESIPQRQHFNQFICL